MNFNESTTAEEVILGLGISLNEKNIIVTGGSSGIGAEAARVFALAGANVWITGRDLSKTKAVADSIASQIENPSNIKILELDLSSLASVKQCAENFLSLGIPLHILLNNAGVMGIQERTETVDGLEMQIGTNHFGHFLLTLCLIEALKAAGQARVAMVSSGAHWRSPILFEDVHLTGSVHSYAPFTAYGQSKTANILHAVELNKRYQADGITAVALHPGVILTDLWRHTGSFNNDNKTVPQGAATSVFCCVAPDIKGGKYYSDCKETDTAEYACDEINASKLWELSVDTVSKFLN